MATAEPSTIGVDIRALIANDGYAVTFQTMGQYRTALLKALDALAQAAPSATPAAPFQARVQPWMLECFGAEIAADQQERNHRFLEEALELVQSCSATASEAHQLVDYVYGRPVGEKHQEAGGVMVTLAALCLAQGLDMHAAGETELARIWTKVEQIRAKQAAKPKHSPLPKHAPAATPADQVNPRQFDVMQSLENIQLPMEGYDPKQLGYEWRKGWNEACRYAMDVFRVNGIKPVSASKEDA